MLVCLIVVCETNVEKDLKRMRGGGARCGLTKVRPKVEGYCFANLAAATTLPLRLMLAV